MAKSVDGRSAPAENARIPVKTLDWDSLQGGEEVVPTLDEPDLRVESEETEQAAQAEAIDDDDNPYNDSDEALPDDDEERTLSRDPGREHPRFDES
jgi:hypothetical protein